MTIGAGPIVVGLLVGLLVGMTGMGGASLMTPIMILVLGVRPVIAVGTDLVYSIITKAVGSGVHLKNATVDTKVTFRLAIGSLPGAVLGVIVLSQLKRRLDIESMDAVVLRMIGGLLVIVAVAMAIRALAPALLKRRSEEAHEAPAWVLPVAGAIVGFLVGLTSVGSGTLIVVVLTLATSLTAQRLVGTDLFHGMLLVVVAGVGQLLVGTVDLGLVANILIGSIPGVWVGSQLSARFPERPLRLVLASVLLISGIKLF